MPNFKHIVETEYTPTFRSEKVAGMFDVPVSDKLRKEWQVNMPIEEKPWSVGIIVGPSGAGKTTIARRAFGEDSYFKGHDWSSPCMLDDFSGSLGVSEITGALSHVGLASPPSWLLPYSALSNGQQFRADLARAILETNGTLVFDEFTSVVDRTVAQVGAYACQKFVRRNNRQFVAVTCHYDVIDWLEPDWVYDVSVNKFTRGSLRRPPIEVKIERCHHSAWQLFKGHHYLSSDINKSSRVYIASVNGSPAALCAVLAFPHPKLKNTYRGHRTVVLPDYQGIGLGNMISEHVGDIMLSEGKRFISTTSHPAMIGHRMKSKKWVATRRPGRLNKTDTKKATKQTAQSSSRLTASFRYIGDVDSAEDGTPWE